MRKTVENALGEALGRILAGDGQIQGELDARLSAAKERLKHQRAQTFPIDELISLTEPSWGAQPDVKQTLEAFLRAKAAVDEEVARLLRLFEEVLKVPEITTAKEAVDCPVCKTPRALTLDRIKAIRTKVEANAELRSKRQSAESALRSINETVTRVVREANGALPQAAQWNDQDRSRNEAVMRELLGQRTDELMSPWRETLSNLDVALG